MPSFDVISEVDKHELTNAVDQASRELNRFIKDLGLKGIQSQTQGDQLRVSGKKRDDLQQAMAVLRGADVDLPLQFDNFRD
jgi:uncharacterized protein YajQ (UPF0234 family)